MYTILKPVLNYIYSEQVFFVCLCFSSGCKNSMNHLREGVVHEAKHRCRYSAHYDNRIYTCKVGAKQCNTWPDLTSCTYSVTAQVWHYVLTCYSRLVMRVAKRWLWFQRRRHPLTHLGLVWPYTPGPGEWCYCCTKVHLLQFI